MSPSFATPPSMFSRPQRERRPRLSSIARAETPTHVVDTAYDSAGVRLATAQADGTISLWRASGADEWVTFAHFETKHEKNALRAIRFAPDRLCPDLLVTIGTDGLAILYKIQVDGEEFSAVTTVLCDATGDLTDVAFAENGLLGTVGEEHVLRLYETPDNGGRWGLLAAVDVGRDVPEARGLSFAPGGAFCVACGDIVARGKVGWEWEVFLRIDEDEEGNVDNAVVCADWASSGFIGVGRADGAVEVWQLQAGTAERLARMNVNEQKASRAVKMEWDKAGGILATANEEKVLQTWTRLSQIDNGRWYWGLRDNLKLADISS